MVANEAVNRACQTCLHFIGLNAPAAVAARQWSTLFKAFARRVCQTRLPDAQSRACPPLSQVLLDAHVACPSHSGYTQQTVSQQLPHSHSLLRLVLLLSARPPPVSSVQHTRHSRRQRRQTTHSHRQPQAPVPRCSTHPLTPAGLVSRAQRPGRLPPARTDSSRPAA